MFPPVVRPGRQALLRGSKGSPTFPLPMRGGAARRTKLRHTKLCDVKPLGIKSLGIKLCRKKAIGIKPPGTRVPATRVSATRVSGANRTCAKLSVQNRTAQHCPRRYSRFSHRRQCGKQAAAAGKGNFPSQGFCNSHRVFAIRTGTAGRKGGKTDFAPCFAAAFIMLSKFSYIPKQQGTGYCIPSLAVFAFICRRAAPGEGQSPTLRCQRPQPTGWLPESPPPQGRRCRQPPPRR